MTWTYQSEHFAEPAALPLIQQRCCRPEVDVIFEPVPARLEQQDNFRVLIPNTVRPGPGGLVEWQHHRGRATVDPHTAFTRLEQDVELPRLSRVTTQPQLKKIGRPTVVVLREDGRQ